MDIKHYPETWRSANVYLIIGEKTYLFDPALPPAKIAEEPDILIGTHAHFDHINQVDVWREEKGVPFYLSEADKPLLKDKVANASELFCQPREYADPEGTFDSGDVLSFEDDLRFKVLLTPGHTKGSACFIVEERDGDDFVPRAILTGDTVFADSIGRMDLPTGSENMMKESLKRFVDWTKDLPGDLPVLPGHGGATTLERLLLTNPYLMNLA